MEKNKRALAKRLEKERLAKEEAERIKKDHADALRMFPFSLILDNLCFFLLIELLFMF
jgi:hypothetical protein